MRIISAHRVTGDKPHNTLNDLDVMVFKGNDHIFEVIDIIRLQDNAIVNEYGQKCIFYHRYLSLAALLVSAFFIHNNVFKVNSLKKCNRKTIHILFLSKI